MALGVRLHWSWLGVAQGLSLQAGDLPEAKQLFSQSEVGCDVWMNSSPIHCLFCNFRRVLIERKDD